MRKLMFITIVCAFLGVPVLAAPHGTADWGGTADWNRISGYYVGNGGEFTLRDEWIEAQGGVPAHWGNTLLLSNSAYANSTKGLMGRPESFQTFCVEVGEYIEQPMKVWVSQEAAGVEPGDNGPGSHAWNGGMNTDLGDDLDPKTAYLYTQFAKGTLNYAYAGTIAVKGLDNGLRDLNRSATAGVLQRVIWNIEQEDGGIPFGTSFQGISLNSSQQALANAYLAAAAGSTSIGNVRVLQTYTISGARAQDQLYLVPVPAAVLLGMLGLSVAGIKLRKYS